jgi:hypothetical protein
MIELLKLWSRIPGEVKSVVLETLTAIVNAHSPKSAAQAARRAAEEAGRLRLFDEAMKRRP